MTFADYLKQLYGEKESMTLLELTKAAESCKTAKFVDLKEGGYVDKRKYSDVSAKLLAANHTIKTLREIVETFDGVDVEYLQRQLDDEKAGRKEYAAQFFCTAAYGLRWYKPQPCRFSARSTGRKYGRYCVTFGPARFCPRDCCRNG